MDSSASDSERGVIFIEWLDIRSLLFDVIPFYSKKRKVASKKIFIFDASAAALFAARCLKPLLGWDVEIVRFEIADIIDGTGFSMRLRLDYFDVAKIQDQIIANPLFLQFLNCFKHPQHLGEYLAKDLIKFDLVNLNRHQQVLHVLTLVNVSRWYIKNSADNIHLFLRKRNWPVFLQNYAKDFNVQLRFVAPFQDLKFLVMKAIRHGLARYLHWGIFWLRYVRTLFRREERRRTQSNNGRYQLAVEYYGHLNLNNDDAFSDLFFYKQSELKGEDIKLLFSLPHDPLDEGKWRQLDDHNISAFVRYPRASCLPISKAAIHDPWTVPKLWHLSDPLPEYGQHFGDRADFMALRNRARDYNAQFGYWRDLFEKGSIRLYTHWYKYDASHIPLADALKSLGGITTLYQRAYESQPIRALAIVADVVFCYSKNNFAVEESNRSDIGYQVVTGFLSDFRFPLLKQKACEIARPLREKGVERIIAFLDENTLDDGRWFPGHAFTQKNYAYLIDKVLKDSRYGIIFKPKAPINLLYRLGPVAQMLKELQATGRCIILGGGSLQGMYPPALAAMAADLTIHECLSAGSAGVESVLAGRPVLFLDVEGWPVSPFYRGGLGTVVFQDWISIWQACSDFFEKSGARATIGNCSSYLEQLDPFRDGLAAQRMGEYLRWLLDGLNTGTDRATVLADAAERYARRWGKDKVHIQTAAETILS